MLKYKKVLEVFCFVVFIARTHMLAVCLCERIYYQCRNSCL